MPLLWWLAVSAGLVAFIGAVIAHQYMRVQGPNALLVLISRYGPIVVLGPLSVVAFFAIGWWRGVKTSIALVLLSIGLGLWRINSRGGLSLTTLQRALQRSRLRWTAPSVFRTCGLTGSDIRPDSRIGGATHTVLSGTRVEWPTLVKRGRRVNRFTTCWKLYPARGKTISDIAAKAHELSDAWNASSVHVLDLGKGAGLLVVLWDDSLAETRRWDASYVDTSGFRVPFAFNEFGNLEVVELIGKDGCADILISGIKGAGKSGALNAIVAGTALLPGVAIFWLDRKRVESAKWLNRSSARAVTVPQIKAGLHELRAEVERRTIRLEQLGITKMTRPMMEHDLPLIVVPFDELAEATARGGDDSKEMNEDLEAIEALSRSTGIIMLGATQRPSHKVIPLNIRDLFERRLCLKVASRESATMALGPDLGNAEPWKIPPTMRGLGYMLASDAGIDLSRLAPRRARGRAILSSLVRRVRVLWIADEQCYEIDRQTAHMKIDLPWLVAAIERVADEPDSAAPWSDEDEDQLADAMAEDL